MCYKNRSMAARASRHSGDALMLSHVDRKAERRSLVATTARSEAAMRARDVCVSAEVLAFDPS
jgi:hypothetical protein